MEITTIYGKAGCGKSTTLAKLILKNDGGVVNDGEDDDPSFVVLAPTNSAVENIYNICLSQARSSSSSSSSPVNRDNFKTIYSYFRIDYINNIVLGPVSMVDTIYIDEFSLMDKFIFKKCVSSMRAHGCKKLVLCGDVMQLNGIYKEKQFISFNKLFKWQSIYNAIYNKLNDKSNLPINLYPKVVEHLHLNVFGMKLIQGGKLIHLTVNRRSNVEIKNLLTQIYSTNAADAANSSMCHHSYPFAHFVDLPNLIIKDSFVFISSRYKILQQIYDYIYEQKWRKATNGITYAITHIEQHISFSSGFKDLYLYPGMGIIVCDTDDGTHTSTHSRKTYINGEELTFTGNIENNCLKCLNRNHEYVYVHKIKEVDKPNSEEFYPICPAFLMTIHKSQGRTLDNVIVCIDELFDVSMMYTAITRAKNKLLFYSQEKDEKKRVELLIKNSYIPEFKQLNLICSYVNRV